MKTRSTKAIKALLCQLFIRSRKGLWNSYDTSIAISYLIQSEFRHIDLLKVLYKNCSHLGTYCHYCCENRFLFTLSDKKVNNYIQIIKNDWKAYFLYFMYWVEKNRHNSLAEYAFYKNYFDRFTADLAFFISMILSAKNQTIEDSIKKTLLIIFTRKFLIQKI